MPTWLTGVYTLFLAVLVPIYWRFHGPANFLWFSDIALFQVGAALWLESSLLASMAAVSVLLLELAWNVDYFARLIAGLRILGLSHYMFDPERPLWLRALSLFHVPLPPLLLWLVHRLGYDSRALLAQTVLAWVVLPATYLLTAPVKNINWVHGLGAGPGAKRPTWTSPRGYVVVLMLAFPLLVYVPTHFLLAHLFTRPD